MLSSEHACCQRSEGPDDCAGRSASRRRPAATDGARYSNQRPRFNFRYHRSTEQYLAMIHSLLAVVQCVHYTVSQRICWCSLELNESCTMFWMCEPRTEKSRSARLLSRGKVAFLARIPVETARYTLLRQIAVNDDK